MTNILRLVVLIALLVLPGSVLSAPAPPPTTIYDLIIIGSGMAGLGAAKRARELGIRNVLIIEARDRIGGRIVTQQLNISMPGNPGTPAFIDLGASWIHRTYGGRGFNPMVCWVASTQKWDFSQQAGILNVWLKPKPQCYLHIRTQPESRS